MADRYHRFVAAVAQSNAPGVRPVFGRCLVACVFAWFSALFAASILLTVVRGLSERWFGDTEPDSRLGFFTSSIHHPLGLYGMATAALVIAVALRWWLWGMSGARIAWWAALAAGALGAAGTQVRAAGNGVWLLLLATGIVMLGTHGRARLPAPPRSVVRSSVALWLVLGGLLFVAAGQAVAHSPLRVGYPGAGTTAELVGLKQAETPPLRLLVWNRSASAISVTSAHVEVTARGVHQALVAGLLPSGGFSLPAPVTRSFTIPPRSAVALGANWTSVCHASSAGVQRLVVRLHLQLGAREVQASRVMSYQCVR